MAQTRDDTAGDGGLSSTLNRGLRSTVVARVHSGRYPSGSRLPGERELAAEFGVSRTTLRRVLQHVAKEGLLEASSKRGWYVPASAISEPPSTLQSFTEMARARGQRARARVLGLECRPPTSTEAAQLAIAHDRPVVELTRLRSIDELPVCHDRSVLIADRVEGILTADLTDRSLFEWLEDHRGIHLLRSAYVLRAAMMPAEFAGLLEVSDVSPALFADEVTYDSEQQAVILGRLVYRADAYHFRSDLFRPERS